MTQKRTEAAEWTGSQTGERGNGDERGFICLALFGPFVPVPPFPVCEPVHSAASAFTISYPAA